MNKTPPRKRRTQLAGRRRDVSLWAATPVALIVEHDLPRAQAEGRNPIRRAFDPLRSLVKLNEAAVGTAQSGMWDRAPWGQQRNRCNPGGQGFGLIEGRPERCASHIWGGDVAGKVWVGLYGPMFYSIRSGHKYKGKPEDLEQSACIGSKVQEALPV